MEANIELLTDKMLLSINMCIGQLCKLREEVMAIKNVTKLQAMAGVSTPAPGDGLTEAKILKLTAHRAKVEAKRHAK